MIICWGRCWIRWGRIGREGIYMFTYFAWIERDEKIELHACLLVKDKGGTKDKKCAF